VNLPQQLNVPNSLTGLRLVAVPVFVGLFFTGHPGAALAVFVLAMITDGLDGMMARMLKQFTQLGAAMDPLADKALGLAALFCLSWAGLLPPWLLGLVLFREICIFTALFILGRTGRSYQIRPTRFGKYATFLLTVTTILALAHGAHEAVRASRPQLLALVLLTAECVFASWAQYLSIFIGLMRAPPGPKPLAA